MILRFQNDSLRLIPSLIWSPSLPAPMIGYPSTSSNWMMRAVIRRKPPGLLAPTNDIEAPLRKIRFWIFCFESFFFRSPTISASTGVSRNIGSISVVL
jgi:hypothetical protein